jgi:hypothetical protein
VREHGLNGLFEREVGSVDVDGVLGALESAEKALLVLFIPEFHFLEDLVKFRRDALGSQLGETAAGPFFRVGVEIELESGIGKDNGPLIAAFRHQAAASLRVRASDGMRRFPLLANQTLLLDEFLANPGIVGGNIGNGGDLGAADRVGDVAVIQEDGGRLAGPIEGNVKQTGTMADAVGIVDDALFERIERDRTVHGTRVKVRNLETSGKFERGGRFSRTSGAINGYDQLFTFA